MEKHKIKPVLNLDPERHRVIDEIWYRLREKLDQHLSSESEERILEWYQRPGVVYELARCTESYIRETIKEHRQNRKQREDEEYRIREAERQKEEREILEAEHERQRIERLRRFAADEKRREAEQKKIERMRQEAIERGFL
jgi:5-methylcytosine-specific restriction endonuclease McrBC GTP-binding regulatory subunit McrB